MKLLVNYLAKSVSIVASSLNICGRSFAIFVIKIYKTVLSGQLGTNCRFYPSCSNYALEAYTKLNFVEATRLTTKRLIACRPFGSTGYAPLERKDGNV